MATFKFNHDIDIHWNGYDIVGPAETVFSIPDQLYEEFESDLRDVEPTLTWIDTNEFQTLSELNNKVYYQTAEPTSPTLTVGDLWVDSDDAINGAISSIIATSPISSSVNTATAEVTLSAISASTSSAGVVQLTDSANSTSTTTAATPNAVLQAIKNIQVMFYNSTTRVGNIPNQVVSGGNAQTSGVIYHTRHIPERNFTVSNLSMVTSTTASSGLTVARFGIYTRSGTTFTLVARTASDTTIFNATNTRFTRALDTTGGYPATYDFVAGNEYWVSVIQVGTTPGNVLGAGSSPTAINNAFGTFVYTDTGEADLVASSTGATSTLRLYAEVS